MDDQRFTDDIAGRHARVERRIGVLVDHLHALAVRQHRLGIERRDVNPMHADGAAVGPALSSNVRVSKKKKNGIAVLLAQDSRAQRLNGEITAPEVRLVAENGDQLGIVPVRDALKMAEEREVDLVEIAPTAVPPVCKLMDFGKFKYREAKKAHEAKLKQKQIQVKEVKFRPGTDEGDYQIKLRNLIKFLDEGDKTKVTLRFRGREMAHQEFGVRLIERVRNDLEPYAVVEQYPKMEGRQLVMVLGPRKARRRGHQEGSKKDEKKAEMKSAGAAKESPPPGTTRRRAAPATLHRPRPGAGQNKRCRGQEALHPEPPGIAETKGKSCPR